MSFNIRYGRRQGRENAWEKRKDFLIETIQAFDPDLLGTQETLAFSGMTSPPGSPTTTSWPRGETMAARRAR